MYTTPAQGHRAGRMLAGLIGSMNKRAQLQLTVDITKASGAKYHQAFRLKAWDSKRAGTRMLTLDLNDGDYMAGTWPTKVAHVDLATGELRAAKGMADAAMLYAAKAAVHYAFTGALLQPGNGTVQVEEAATCGCCGLRLTHPVSIDLGIGPECARRMGLEHHYKGTALTSRAKCGTRTKAKEEAGATAPAPAPLAAPEVGQVLAATQVARDVAAAAHCEHGADYMQCLACHNALLHQLDTDIATTQALHNAAANAHAYDQAERHADVLDTLRGMRSKAVAEWQGNHSVQAWEQRVAAHPAAQGLSQGDKLLVAHWCYVNHTDVPTTMEALGMQVPSAA